MNLALINFKSGTSQESRSFPLAAAYEIHFEKQKAGETAKDWPGNIHPFMTWMLFVRVTKMQLKHYAQI